MKQLVLSVIALVAFNSAYAHTIKFEGKVGDQSNAVVIYNGLQAAAATNTNVIFKKGHYGTQVSQEDVYGAIYCKTIDSYDKVNGVLLDGVKTDGVPLKDLVSCQVYIKHGDDLGPLDSYPVGSSADWEGDSSSVAATVFNILKGLNGTDENVELTKIKDTENVERGTAGNTISCKFDGKFAKCNYQQ